MKDQEELEFLEQEIKRAKSKGESVEKYILREIEILKNTISKFLETMESQGRLSDPNTVYIEIRQYTKIKELAEKVNLPTQEYDDLIKEAQCKVLGEKNWNIFFGQ